MDMKFNGYDCSVKLNRYANNRAQLHLYDKEDGCPVAVATINVPNEDILPGEVIVKNYSENEGMYEALLEAKIISPSHRIIRSGHVVCPVAFLADKKLYEPIINITMK